MRRVVRIHCQYHVKKWGIEPGEVVYGAVDSLWIDRGGASCMPRSGLNLRLKPSIAQALCRTLVINSACFRRASWTTYAAGAQSTTAGHQRVVWGLG